MKIAIAIFLAMLLVIDLLRIHVFNNKRGPKRKPVTPHIPPITMGKRKFTIPVTWEMYGKVKVEAESLEEAMEKAREAKLPDGDYVEDSFRLDDEEVIKEMNNILTDKNGNELNGGETVIVPDPTTEDNWNHSFMGQILQFKDGYAIVVDGEGDCFSVEPERLEIQD